MVIGVAVTTVGLVNVNAPEPVAVKLAAKLILAPLVKNVTGLVNV